MYDENSPIIDFYPEEFEQDLNGKKQEWEAIVKIPFIDEARLLKAMAGGSYGYIPYVAKFSYLSSPSSPYQLENTVLQKKRGDVIPSEVLPSSRTIQRIRRSILHRFLASSQIFTAAPAKWKRSICPLSMASTLSKAFVTGFSLEQTR